MYETQGRLIGTIDEVALTSIVSAEGTTSLIKHTIQIYHHLQNFYPKAEKRQWSRSLSRVRWQAWVGNCIVQALVLILKLRNYTEMAF